MMVSLADLSVAFLTDVSTKYSHDNMEVIPKATANNAAGIFQILTIFSGSMPG